MKLIDADALKENLRTWDDTGVARLLIEVICGAIDDRPEAIVRCKDCKHRPTGDQYGHDLEFPDYECPCQCDDFWYSWMPDDDWYCANGERKTDD